MEAVEATILSALISAVVAFIIVGLKEFVFESRKEKKLGKQLISAWISDMTANVNLLKVHEYRLAKLTYDDRPLNPVALALHRPDLAKTMTDIRVRIRYLNELITLYDAVLGPQLNYLLMTDPLKESIIPQQEESGELETSRRIRKWRDDWLELIDGTGDKLRMQIEKMLEEFQPSESKKDKARP